MSYTINTNIAGLQAQDYLRITTDFQQKTINRVTSGLRIVNSGDDAAGLAIANGFRSDRAVLTQGVRNANDGLSTLQTIDGGINNISQLIDRARTLAAQSSSGTLPGGNSRTVLNSEFQSVIGEIDRQAQAIGLDQNGLFAKSLSVFIGGGRDNNGISSIANGSVAVDLSTSSVDSKSLGLKGLQAAGGTAGITDLGNASTTSIANIVNNNANTTSEAVTGFTDFYFRGPGFSDSNRVKVSVNLAGVTDTSTLVSAINSSIATAGNGSSPAATAFKSAGVTASIVTDTATGKQRLAFTSSNTAFQASAGDRVSNALLGNFSADSTGVDLTYSVTGGGNVASTTTAWAANSNIIVRVQGGSLSSPVDLTLSAGVGASTSDAALISLSVAAAANAQLQAAGISLTTGTLGSPLQFTSKRGETFEVLAAGDTGGGATTQGLLGLGKFQLAASGGSSFDYSTVTGTGGVFNAAGSNDYVFSLGGGAATPAFTIANTTNSTLSSTIDAFNAAFSANAQLQAAGLVASNNAGQVQITSANGTQFRADLAANTGINLGFGSTAAASAYSANTNSGVPANSALNSGGAAATQLLNYSAIRNGSDDQTVTVSATDAAGVEKSAFIVLANDASIRNARSLDEAINTINNKLQQTNIPALQKIVAVKEIDGGVSKIQFIGANSAFKVSVGTNGGGSGVGSQGTVQDTTVSAGGATADISTQANAQAAVSALAAAVSLLGSAQAVVGKGQNAFNFAVNLASTQLTNLAAAESRIRDADLAQEAANLTKAQILQQAGVAALAQANSAPQVVLSLLKG
jgi:flagellin